MAQSDTDFFDNYITNTNIQSLSSREAIYTFFSHIGYNTKARITQTPGNLGINADSVTRQIRYIERIADQDNSLQIYLFEVDSVTIALTRYLSRIFRDFRGHFMLVITSDYERIDFVLVETYTPAGNGETASISPTRKLAVRPRILTVERRKPTRVQLRVLNRFPYTEPDPYAQYDKLLSAYNVADWSEEFFNNRALFSDYYLKERLRDTDEWKEDPRHAYNGIQKIFSKNDSFLSVLKSLGFNAIKVDRKEKVEEPNYRLYVQGNDSKPVTVALSYPWNRYLDGPDETRDPDTPDENPGKVVVSILEKGETDWAIVTNGKIWRLYSRKTHSRATNYYEIDLEEVLASRYDSPEQSFRYFWLLFRAKAFQPIETIHEGEKRTSTFLDTLLEGSRDYAKELGERLKERVFNEIFPHFAAGFIQYIRDTEGSEADLSRERLDNIFHGTLALLYRLLFIFYAESRDLLPVKEVRGYYEKSLRKLTQEISDAAGSIQDEAQERLKKSYSGDSTELYERLTELFRVIDEGNARINVPCYNGSLFMTDPGDEDASEAKNARFLMKHKIPDRHLALGLNLMARDVDDKLLSLVFIDYKSLGVRQLGSIYEGLLEFKLEIADGKLGIVKDKGREVYVPFSELSEAQQSRAERQGQTIKKGQVYLSNDKRERKATGSYYTPDYIVKYIVENTVGPVLEEKFDKMRPKFRSAEKDYRDAVRRQDSFHKLGMPGSDPEKVANTYRLVVNELFDLSILDPAMGSGHFLVEAVDFVTDKMITFLNAFPWNPVVATLRETRETILESMSKQEITIDINRLTDVNLLKRHVLKRCVYGVDLNPMAVELAKVSLWLDCFTLGAPLSFLDHHLKCGNSLIGSRIETVRKEVESDLFGTQFAGLITATAGLIHVGELSDVTVAQVKESAQAFRDASSVLEPFKEVLDFWTAQYFCDESEANDIRNVFLSGRFPQIKRGWHNELNSARTLALRSSKIADERRFFHWELEFPEVFFGPRSGTTQAIAAKENPGFDVVIGNPPYIQLSMEQYFDPNLKSYLLAVYKSSMGRLNTFGFFLRFGMKLIRETGYEGMIVPNTVLTMTYYAELRKMILDECRIKRILNFENLAFEEAVVENVVLVLQSESGEKARLCNSVKLDSVTSHLSQGDTFHEIPQETFVKYYENIFNPYLTDQLLAVKDKLWANAYPFSRIVHINQAIALKHNRANWLFKERFGSNFKPLLDGRYIDRYEISFPDIYLKYDVRAIHSCKREDIFLADEKIFFRRVGDRIIACYDDNQFYALNTLVVINLKETASRLSLKFLLTLLDSRLLNWYFVTFLKSTKEVFSEIQARQIEQLPVRHIDFGNPTDRSQHDELVFHAQEMIDMNRIKQSEQKRFLSWMQEQLHIIPDKEDNVGIEALSGKTTLQNYPGSYEKSEEPTDFSDILNVLQKNKSKIRANLSDAAFVRTLEREYEKSLEILLPIKDRLAKTDRLIDQIVYKLYGLTEEEIAIVEGRG